MAGLQRHRGKYWSPDTRETPGNPAHSLINRQYGCQYEPPVVKRHFAAIENRFHGAQHGPLSKCMAYEKNVQDETRGSQSLSYEGSYLE